MSAIEVKHVFSLPIETVFGAFSDKMKFENFFFRSEGGVLVESELNPEVGGQFLIIEKRADQTVPHHVSFLEFEVNEKISFVFGVGDGADETNYVEMEFNTRPKGTEITVKTEIDNPEMVDKSKLGWAKIMQGLDVFLAKGAQAGVTQPPKDSQGNVLDNDDVVRVIKDLTVKGSSMVVKRGTTVKRVRLIPGNNEEVDCKVEGVALRLETQWLLKG
jgi:uncharacterized Zn ribbon protein